MHIFIYIYEEYKVDCKFTFGSLITLISLFFLLLTFHEQNSWQRENCFFSQLETYVMNMNTFELLLTRIWLTGVSYKYGQVEQPKRDFERYVKNMFPATTTDTRSLSQLTILYYLTTVAKITQWFQTIISLSGNLFIQYLSLAFFFFFF